MKLALLFKLIIIPNFAAIASDPKPNWIGQKRIDLLSKRLSWQPCQGLPLSSTEIRYSAPGNTHKKNNSAPISMRYFFISKYTCDECLKIKAFIIKCWACYNIKCCSDCHIEHQKVYHTIK